MTIRIVLGVFSILHGLVHLLYFGQSARYFELQPGMAWPNGAWAFSRLLENDSIRLVADILLVAAAVGFAIGGIGVLAQQGWWRMILIAAAVFSSIIYILLWDGNFQNLDDKGAIGILINIIILISLLAFQYPDFDF